MRRLHLRLVVLPLLLAPLCSWAGEPLSLDDCFRAALERSDVLADQQELVVQAEENYHRAWGAILPAVNATYAYVHEDTAGHSNSGNTQSSADQQTLTFTGDQSLFRGFRDFAALHGAKALITAQEQSREWAGMQLYADMAQAYYTRLAVQKDLQVLDNELALYAERVKDIQDRVAIGRSRITEVLTVQAAQAILRAQREQVLGQLNVAKEVVAFLTGLDQDTPLADTDGVPAAVASLESYQADIPLRPDIAAAKNNVEAFQANVTVAKGAELPSVDVIGNYYFERPDVDDHGDWDVELAVTMPIFTGGINRSKVKTAASQKRQSEIQLDQVQRLALQEIRTLHDNVTADIAQLAALQEAYAVSENNYKATADDYQHSLVNNLDVLVALQAYQDTDRSLEKIRYLTKIDFSKLEAAAARRLTLMEGAEKR